jgi:hypothetical protein
MKVGVLPPCSEEETQLRANRQAFEADLRALSLGKGYGFLCQNLKSDSSKFSN